MQPDRAHISKWTWARVMARYLFRCAKCFTPFKDGDRVDLDHIHQLAMGGPDDAANLRPLCEPCHKIKTRNDAKARAKVRRLRGETCTAPRKKITSRGFDRTRRKKMTDDGGHTA